MTTRHGAASRRVLIIGLDGATFDLLDPLMDAGLLPTIASLARQGIRAPLRSTMPYVTAPAWTSLVTGKKPETHGVYDWTRQDPRSYRRRLWRGPMIPHAPFWEILMARGIPAGAVNVPMSHPIPPEAAAFSIGDMFTPPSARRWAHPPELQRRLHGIGYRRDVAIRDYADRGLAPFVSALVGMIERRCDALGFCLRRYPWRAAIAVFVAPDRIQHAYWHVLASGEARTPDFEQALRVFVAIDRAIERIRAALGEEDHLYLVSDHGFGIHKQTFYINQWLEEQGYLRFHPPRRWRGAAARIVSRAQAEIGHFVIDRVKAGDRGRRRWEAIQRGIGGRLGSPLVPGGRAVDWRRTHAFADTPHGVRLNLRGREPCGIIPKRDYDAWVRRLCVELGDLAHPETGAKLYRRVEPREWRYAGPALEGAPDVVYTFADEGTTWRIGDRRAASQGRTHPRGTGVEPSHPPLTDAVGAERGTHRSDGILIAAGPDLRQGALRQPCALWDVIPTLFYHLDEGIPPDMDGTVLVDAFKPSVLRERPEKRAPALGRRSAASNSGPEQSPPWTADDERAVEDHLRALGYLA